ncbi:MAG: hypothetical protein ABI647_26050 [Gemmatimonadota bacterium]
MKLIPRLLLLVSALSGSIFAAEPSTVRQTAAPLNVLVVGGGSSHDFAIKTLATVHSPSKNVDFPSVFVVELPNARIAGIALGNYDCS